MFGGREGIRTPDPLLAKQVGKNTKLPCWCRLHEKPSKFPLFNCPEVVPNGSIKHLGHRQSDQRRNKQTRFVQSHFEAFRDRLLKPRIRPPLSEGEMVFSSTKITPPCLRPSSPQVLRSGGIVLRS